MELENKLSEAERFAVSLGERSLINREPRVGRELLINLPKRALHARGPKKPNFKGSLRGSLEGSGTLNEG